MHLALIVIHLLEAVILFFSAKKTLIVQCNYTVSHKREPTYYGRPM